MIFEYEKINDDFLEETNLVHSVCDNNNINIQ